MRRRERDEIVDDGGGPFVIQIKPNTHACLCGGPFSTQTSTKNGNMLCNYTKF